MYIYTYIHIYIHIYIYIYIYIFITLSYICPFSKYASKENYKIVRAQNLRKICGLPKRAPDPSDVQSWKPFAKHLSQVIIDECMVNPH